MHEPGSDPREEELTQLPVADPLAELPAAESGHIRVSVGMQIVNLTAVILPFLGIFAAAIFLWGRGFSWVDLVLLLVMYLLTGLGITVGFHRCLPTARSRPTACCVIIGVFGSIRSGTAADG